MKSPLIALIALVVLCLISPPANASIPDGSYPPANAGGSDLIPKTLTQEKPALSSIDRIRLAEAFRLGERIGDSVWPGWSKAPFAVLLVTPDYEFLMRHPAPSADFKKAGHYTTLKTEVYYRKRVFSTHLLATFPAISGSAVSTIVVGQAENTSAKTSTQWVITLLHEHFHQLQDSQPNLYAEVNALNLARGDKTGMWMLNYPFPYDRKEVGEQFATMSTLLSEALKDSTHDGREKLSQYLEAREKFQSMLAPDDYNYLSFQLWKEGIARYTEIHLARAAISYRPRREFILLHDYQPFAAVAKEIYERTLRQLVTQKLPESKREVVYSYGAAEGLLLDRVNARWRQRYFVEKFDLKKFFRK